MSLEALRAKIATMRGLSAKATTEAAKLYYDERAELHEAELMAREAAVANKMRGVRRSNE